MLQATEGFPLVTDMGRAMIALFIVAFFFMFVSFTTGIVGCWRTSPSNITSSAILMLLACKYKKSMIILTLNPDYHPSTIQIESCARILDDKLPVTMICGFFQYIPNSCHQMLMHFFSVMGTSFEIGMLKLSQSFPTPIVLYFRPFRRWIDGSLARRRTLRENEDQRGF